MTKQKQSAFVPTARLSVSRQSPLSSQACLALLETKRETFMNKSIEARLRKIEAVRAVEGKTTVYDCILLFNCHERDIPWSEQRIAEMTGRPVGDGDIVWRVVWPKDRALDPDQPRKEPRVLEWASPVLAKG